MPFDDDLYRLLVENLFDGVYFVDSQRRITSWNKAAERISGFSSKEVLGRDCGNNILCHADEKGRDLCDNGCPLQAAMEDGEYREHDVWLRHKDGRRVPVNVRVAPVTDAAERRIGAMEVFRVRRDSCPQPLQAPKTITPPTLDELTGLGSRRYAEMIFASRLEELRSLGTPFGALFMDVDDFKVINDVHGHMTGDRTLTMVGSSIAGALRSRDVVCRWGGEEFVAVATEVDEERLAGVAERVRVMVEKSWIELPDGRRLRTTVSVGATMAKPEDDVLSLLDRADRLMYASKAAGKNLVTLA